MAARYIAEIRRVQPRGPYHLGGYSMGGLIAYEMAQQLRAAGERVGLLALLDTYQHHGRRRFGHLPVWIEPDKDALSGATLAAAAQRLALRSRFLALNARTALWRGLFGTVWRFCEISRLAMPKPLQRPVAANLLAVRSYRLPPYDGDAVLFAASRYSWDRKDWDAGWRALVRGGLDVEPIPGLHHEILEEPNVGVLARTLSRLPSRKDGTGRRARPSRSCCRFAHRRHCVFAAWRRGTPFGAMANPGATGSEWCRVGNMTFVLDQCGSSPAGPAALRRAMPGRKAPS